MRFSNLSPAERMKASGLIGLIVVILFFVVHTVLGAIAPKPAAAPPPDGGAAPTPGPTPPANTSVAGSPVPPSVAFPSTKNQKPPQIGGGNPALVDTPDPFIPIRDSHGKLIETAASSSTESKKSPPAVEVQSLPGLDGTGGAPATGGSNVPILPAGPQGPVPAPIAVAPPPEPEIRLIGLITGQPSVATVEVEGRVLLVHVGDTLAEGYHVTHIGDQGITIRHSARPLALHVGDVLNPRSTQKSPAPEDKKF